MAYPSSFIFHDLDHDNEGPRHGSIPSSFKPTAHIFYGERLMEVLDGVPKWEGHKDDSKRMEEVSEAGEHGGKGGSGEFMGSKRKHSGMLGSMEREVAEVDGGGNEEVDGDGGARKKAKNGDGSHM